MEKIKRLYPLVFHPIVMEEPWGKENIAIADLGIEDSVVAEGWLSDNSIGEIMETYLERVVGDEVYSYYGRQFPVLVKGLDIDGEMPVYVHPDDEIAEQRYDSLGGKELWYIVGAEPDAMIYLGFSQDVTAAELYERCGNGTVRDVMNHVRPSAGDFFMVEPGIPHSASGKMKITVIKESSELPFRLYDKHEQDRETLDTHLAETMDFISYGKYTVPSCRTENESEIETIADCPEFRINRIRLADPVHSFSEQAGSYILYICIEGEASVQIPVSDAKGRINTENRYLKKGEVMLVPAEVNDFFVLPVDRSTVLLEVSAGKREDADSYINPDTEPFLEGEDYEGLEDEESTDDEIKPGKVSGKHDMQWN